MFPVAHIASGMLFNRLLYKDKGVAAAALGSLIPDAVDKPLAWVLRVTPSSHYLAHTPLAAAGLSLIVARLCGRRAARAFASAYLLHLLTDDLHHGRVPWLLPFSRNRRLPRRRSIWLFAIGLLGEVPAFALAQFLLRRSKRCRRQTMPRSPSGMKANICDSGDGPGTASASGSRLRSPAPSADRYRSPTLPLLRLWEAR